MEFGTTSGRGFEGAFAPLFWATIIVGAFLLWAWLEYDIRKRKREEKADREQDG